MRLPWPSRRFRLQPPPFFPIVAAEVDDMDRLQFLFNACAVAGGALFAFRLAMQIVGASADVPADAPVALDSADADSSFRAVSLLGITAFLMMFGLGGRAMLESRPGAAAPAVLVGLLAGGASLWLMAKLFKAMRKLQSSGTASLAKAVGQEATVYLSIPANDVGKIQVVFHGRLSVVDARSANAQPLPTGTRVKVARLLDGGLLEVEAL